MKASLLCHSADIPVMLQCLESSFQPCPSCVPSLCESLQIQPQQLVSSLGSSKTDLTEFGNTASADAKSLRCCRKSFPISSSLQPTLQCRCGPAAFVEWSEMFKWESCVILKCFCVVCRRGRDHIKEKKFCRKPVLTLKIKWLPSALSILNQNWATCSLSTEHKSLFLKLG